MTYMGKSRSFLNQAQDWCTHSGKGVGVPLERPRSQLQHIEEHLLVSRIAVRYDQLPWRGREVYS